MRPVGAATNRVGLRREHAGEKRIVAHSGIQATVTTMNHVPSASAGRFANRRAFTLLELIVAITLATVLTTLAVPTYNVVVGQGQDGQAKDSITTALVAARRVASLPGNHNSFPASWQTASCFMLPWNNASACTGAASPNLNLIAMVLPPTLSMTSTGPSTGYTVLSVFTGTVSSSAVAVLAAKAADGNCMVVIDNPNTSTGDLWGYVPATGTGSGAACTASSLFATYGPAGTGVLTGTYTSPALL